MKHVTSKRTYDAALIRSIVTAPGIWECVSENGQQKHDYEPPIIDAIEWVALTNEKSQVIGVLLIHPLNTVTCECHINIIPKYRQEYSMLAGLACRRYMLEDTEYDKFNTQVPDIYPNVAKFLKQFGFVHEGTNRKSINKHDTLVDQHHYGITRPELTNIIKEH